MLKAAKMTLPECGRKPDSWLKQHWLPHPGPAQQVKSRVKWCWAEKRSRIWLIDRSPKENQRYSRPVVVDYVIAPIYVLGLCYLHLFCCMNTLIYSSFAGWPQRILLFIFRNGSVFPNTREYYPRFWAKGVRSLLLLTTFACKEPVVSWSFVCQLAGAGYGVGVRMLELVCFRERGCKREIKVRLRRRLTVPGISRNTIVLVGAGGGDAELHKGHHVEDHVRQASRLSRARHREGGRVWESCPSQFFSQQQKAMAHSLSFSCFTQLAALPKYALIKKNTADMIHDKEPLVNTYISVPKDFGHLNCAAFVAGAVHGMLESGPPSLLRPPFSSLPPPPPPAAPLLLPSHFIARPAAAPETPPTPQDWQSGAGGKRFDERGS
jgi:hypothetical protein